MLSPEATSQERRLLHKAAAAVLAVPVLSAVYVGALVRRAVVSRIGLAIVVGGLLGVGVIGAGLPAATSARPPTPIVPLTRAAFQTTVVTEDRSAAIASPRLAACQPEGTSGLSGSSLCNSAGLRGNRCRLPRLRPR